MNIFGQHLKMHIYGTSHGPEVGVLLEGVPAGISLGKEDFLTAIERRKPTQKGTTPRKESDEIHIRSGVFKGFTTGTPILISFLNENTRSEDYESQRSFPRPGHADWAAHKKFLGFEDFRGGGAFSARLTVGLVAAGVVAQQIIDQYLDWTDFKIESKILKVGVFEHVEEGLAVAIAKKDSVGGVIQITAEGVPPGLGEPYFYGLDAAIAQAIFSIPAVKGLEFGAGFKSVEMFGSEHNDPILNEKGQTKTNHSGGVTGGLSNGNPLQFQVVLKPTSSTPQTQLTYDWHDQKIKNINIKGRHDLCVALRAPVILEAITMWVLADLGLMFKKLPNESKENYFL